MSADETIKEVVAEMRRRMKSHYYQIEARNVMRQYADRIEAAWKREKAEIEANALNVGAFVATTEKSSAVGNAAAMRRTLERIDMMIVSINCVDGVQKRSIDNCRNLIKQALSEPPRNCDKFNSGDPTKDAADSYDEWQRHCDCPLMPPSCKIESAFKQWLFVNAKSETKGENNERK